MRRFTSRGPLLTPCNKGPALVFGGGTDPVIQWQMAALGPRPRPIATGLPPGSRGPGDGRVPERTARCAPEDAGWSVTTRTEPGMATQVEVGAQFGPDVDVVVGKGYVK